MPTTDTRPRRKPMAAPIRLDQLVAHDDNIRGDLTDINELAASIRTHGLLQPLTGTEHPTEPDQFLILAGHRRAKAAALAGLVGVPCVIRDIEDTDEQIALMLVENCQRVDLNPMEQALALGALRRRGRKQDDLVKMTGKSLAWVSNRLALLDLSEQEQAAISVGAMKASEAIEIVKDRRRDARGGTDRDRGWTPPYFAKSHQLARKATRLCDGRGHNARRRVGGVACGSCWEHVIRTDERAVIAAEHEINNETDQPLGATA